MNADAASSLIDQPPVRRVGPTLTMAPRIVKAARARGPLTPALPASYTISFSPSFIVTLAEIDDTIARAGAAVDAVADELVRDGVWADAA